MQAIDLAAATQIITRMRGPAPPANILVVAARDERVGTGGEGGPAPLAPAEVVAAPSPAALFTAAELGPVPALALGQQHGRRGGAVGWVVLGVYSVVVVDLKRAE